MDGELVKLTMQLPKRGASCSEQRLDIMKKHKQSRNKFRGKQVAMSCVLLAPSRRSCLVRAAASCLWGEYFSLLFWPQQERATCRWLRPFRLIRVPGVRVHGRESQQGIANRWSRVKSWVKTDLVPQADELDEVIEDEELEHLIDVFHPDELMEARPGFTSACSQHEEQS